MTIQSAAGAVIAPIARILPLQAAQPRVPLFLEGKATLVATNHSYDMDEEIFGEGEQADHVYQVIRGVVRAHKTLSDGRRQIAAFHLPGDVFGLPSSKDHQVTAEAVTACTLRLVRRRTLESLAKDDVEVAGTLWGLAAANLQHAEDHMLLLGCKSALERVAAFLIEMNRRMSAAGVVDLPMTRRDIGDYLGLTLETVSRAVSQLRAQGVLNLSSARHITVANPRRLSAMAA